MTNELSLLERITARPEVFNGTPIVCDMRISVELVLSLMTQSVCSLDSSLFIGPAGSGRQMKIVARTKSCWTWIELFP